MAYEDFTTTSIGTKKGVVISSQLSGVVGVTAQSTQNKSTWTWNVNAQTTLSPKISLYLRLFTDKNTDWLTIANFKTMMLTREEITYTDKDFGTIKFYPKKWQTLKKSKDNNVIEVSLTGVVSSW